jgi:hypothetical protein
MQIYTFFITFTKTFIMNLKTHTIVLLFGMALMYFLMSNCSKEPRPQTVYKTKEIIGKIPPAKVIEKPIYISDKSEVNRLKKLYNFSQAEIDSLLAETDRFNDFAMGVHDSLQAEIKKLIALKEFNQPFEDTVVKIDVSGVVRGDIKKMKIDYKVKPIEFTQKTVVFRTLIGASIGINKELNQGVISANLGFQNKKGNLFTVQAMQVDNQTYFLTGVNFSLFKVER